MFPNGPDGQAGRQSKQPTETRSYGRMQARGPSIASMRNAGDLTSLTGPANLPRKRRTRDALLFRNAALGGPGQHLFHSSQIAVKLRTLWFWKRRGVKRWTRNEGGWRA